MSGGFQTPITIKTAIDNIHNRIYLLPAIQRKFVWSSEQIELLFDSILRGYPINSFMFWKISDEKIKNGYRFYEFITNYREFFAENNKDIDTNGVPDFYAVIDGQQRLTSLYIGLRGTYAYKMPRRWWRDDQVSLPTRELYLNLSGPSVTQYDNQKLFDFKFLSKSDLDNDKNNIWYRVGDILTCSGNNELLNYIVSHGYFGNTYALDTLSKLYEVVHVKTLINYYLQEEQDSDKVLEIFIRTNSGGTSLSFSDLLMSIASANWQQIDPRKEFEQLISEIYCVGRPGFIINKDFILKTCLVLFVDDIRFKLKNFTFGNVQKFEDNWQKVRKSITAAFRLFEQLGLNDTTFRAKNAAIPVIYHIYYNDLAETITKQTYSDEEKKNIARWLILTFIKSIFGGQTDSVLLTMRKVLKDTQCKNFPVKELMEAFKNNPARNYNFDDDFIDGLLEAQKDSNEAFYVLHLIYSGLDYANMEFHQDHLHPASVFKSRDKLTASIPSQDLAFAEKPENWNSVANLQLLNGNMNSSKNDTPLEEWVSKHKISKHDLFVDESTSLKIADFKTFIEERRKILKENLILLLNHERI